MVSNALTDQAPMSETTEVIWAALPPEQYLRRDRSFEFTRNGGVYAVDGRVGVLKYVVVDESAGEVRELIVLVESTRRTIRVPVEMVDKTGGSAIFLWITREQFAESAVSAPNFERKRFTKASTRAVRKHGGEAAERKRREAVTQLGRDFVATLTVSRLDPT
jgi:hypothetical protein